MPGFLSVRPQDWAQPAPPPPSDALFLFTHGGTTGLIRVMANGTTGTLGTGTVLAAAMGQSADLFSDYEPFSTTDEFSHSTDSAETWAALGDPDTGITVGSGEFTSYRRDLGSSAAGVAYAVVFHSRPFPNTRFMYLRKWESGAWSTLETVTVAALFTSSGTQPQEHDQFCVANAGGIWWCVGNFDFSAGNWLGHLRRTTPAGSGAYIDLLPGVSGEISQIQDVLKPNHDDTDSVLVRTYSPSTPAHTRLVKVVGTTATDLTPAVGLFPNDMDWWGSTIFAAVGNVIEKSIDGGANFNNVFTAPHAVARIQISQTDQNKIVALSNEAAVFWLSTDGGDTWAEQAMLDIDIATQIPLSVLVF